MFKAWYALAENRTTRKSEYNKRGSIEGAVAFNGTKAASGGPTGETTPQDTDPGPVRKQVDVWAGSKEQELASGVVHDKASLATLHYRQVSLDLPSTRMCVETLIDAA